MHKTLSLHFSKSGLNTTVQDFGRNGFQHLGIPLGGALDKQAMLAANRILNNPKNTPVLECTLIGPEIEFTGTGSFCLTGAEMNGTLNGEPIERYQAVPVNDGDVLRMHAAKDGCRGYIGINGLWQLKNWLDSASSLTQYLSLNGFMGAIKENDTIEIIDSSPVTSLENVVIKKPYYSSCYILRVVTGPEFPRFSIEQIEAFFHQIFTVSQDANRMGYRLKESLSDYVAVKEEISSGIIPGTIQITNSGQPIVLLADAQTTGGYPRIANVISEDLDLFGQIKPGDEIKFTLASL